MTKEQQDLAWACLSKEMKARIKERHQSTSFNTPTRNTLNEVFGYHNLISDIEPTELLFVERKKVQELYAAFESRQSEAYPGEDTEFWKGNKSGLKYLFGDKCLPDKEPPVQVEPKFRKGEKVRIADKKVETFGNIATITHCEVDDGKAFYWLNDDIGYYDEYQLEPYTEPENKDNMEEKELNLCELLHLGYEVYNPTFGYGRVDLVNTDIKPYFCVSFEESAVFLSFCSNGLETKSKSKPSIWPSEVLYEKYPLNAKAAWMEWKEAQKPKRWRAVIGAYFYTITTSSEIGSLKDAYTDYTNNLYELGNYFRTKEEAKQAAKAIKECLIKFHERNNK